MTDTSRLSASQPDTSRAFAQVDGADAVSTAAVSPAKADRAREIARKPLVWLLCAAIIAAFVVFLGPLLSPERAPEPRGLVNGGFVIGGASSTATGSAHQAAMPLGPSASSLQITVFSDYASERSATFASASGLLLQRLVQEGQAQIVVVPVVAPDGSDTDYSVRSTAAAACVYDVAPADFWAFHLMLFANQSPKRADALSNDDLVMLARDTGVHNLADVTTCVEDGRFVSWVKDSRRVTGGTLVSAVPTAVDVPIIFVNDRRFDGRVESAEALREFLGLPA